MAELNMIVGPMFSGKSEELLRLAKRHGYAGRKIVAIKPKLDDRQATIRSRRLQDGQSITAEEFPAIAISSEAEFDNLITEQWPDVLIIDECQFFDSWLLEKLKSIITNPKSSLIIYASGLDQDAYGNPFGHIGELLAIADTITKMTAICFNCGAEAVMTAKISKGNGQVVQTGDVDLYQARCRRCWTPPL